jgi:two-component system response regulator DevR
MATSASATNENAFSRLGQQEKQVLLLLSDGRSDKDIARALSLGEGTIRNYVHSILSKLELADRAGAVAYAQKHDLRGQMGSSD